MVSAPSFLQLYLRIQPPTLASGISTRNLPSTSGNFQLLILLLLVRKIILKIPTNTPFPYTSAIFHVPFFAYSHPNNLHQKCFLYLSHLANSGCVKEPVSYGVL